ncbi:hypothetical protein BU251_05925 [Candidatus Velamenicoccus archaeovorus]|uniref:Uncharacterized protein n=1 Tax=Velamenicoccus archaeovorus TaxID=1930593 RepID=A0A410P596_VELA1|nr:hypothetical protein BU251_05925 [Candidatus Velamenicoccus archaeovorus]
MFLKPLLCPGGGKREFFIRLRTAALDEPESLWRENHGCEPVDARRLLAGEASPKGGNAG